MTHTLNMRFLLLLFLFIISLLIEKGLITRQYQYGNIDKISFVLSSGDKNENINNNNNKNK